jgi:hypothetical protein
MILSEEILRKRIEKLSREEINDFVLGIVTDPAIKPLLSLRKQIESCENVEILKDIKPFTEKGGIQIEMMAKYYKSLKDLVNALDFFMERLGLTKFLTDVAASELKSTTSAEKSDLTYEDLIKKKP